MFHATLIIGGSEIQRLKQAEAKLQVPLKEAEDILIITPDPSVGIDKVRLINRFLSRKPLRLKYNICFLPQAETLTIPAQNALLKTLEEPPAAARIILAAPSTAKLLSTVVSRCQVISLKSEININFGDQEKIFKQIAAASPGEKIALAGNFAADAKPFCHQQLQWFHLRLNLHHSAANLNLIDRLTATLTYLDANVNPKLCLEQLLVSYPTSQPA